MTYTMSNRTPFTVSLKDAKALIGETVRIRWIDEWGEAFYIGKVEAAELYTGDETPESVLLGLADAGGHPLAAIILPIGKELDLWTI